MTFDSKVRIRLVIGGLLHLAGSLSSAAYGSDLREDAQFALTEMWTKAESIQSASGTIRVSITGGDEGDKEFQAKFFVDYIADHFRVDMDNGKTSAQMVWRPEHLLHHELGRAVIGKYSIDDPYILDQGKRLDVRLLGIGTWMEFEGGTLLEDAQMFLDSIDDVTAVGDDSRGWEFAWTYPFGGTGVAKRTVWLEEIDGLRPVKTVVEITGPGADEPDMRESAELKWNSIDGEMAIVSIVSEDWRRDSHLIGTVELTWDSINKPLDPVVFTPEGLKAPGGTVISNMQLATPVVEGIVPGNGTNDLSGAPAQSSLQREEGRSVIFLVIGANLVVFTFIIVLLVRRRRSISSNRSEQ